MPNYNLENFRKFAAWTPGHESNIAAKFTILFSLKLVTKVLGLDFIIINIRSQIIKLFCNIFYYKEFIKQLYTNIKINRYREISTKIFYVMD